MAEGGGGDDGSAPTTTPAPTSTDDRRAGRLSRTRSVIDTSLPFRKRILDEFFLLEDGDRETVRLLMRGMPLPVTFGFPGCSRGAIWENYVGFVELFHPFVSIFTVHPLCPFSKKERLVVWICSLAFNFVWTEVMNVQAKKIHDKLGKDPYMSYTIFLTKHIVTVLYAVFIRQIVICPCLYEPIIRAAFDDETHHTLSDAALAFRADKLRTWKRRGDRTILILLLVHIAMIVFSIAFAALSNRLGFLSAQNVGVPPGHIILFYICASEAFNFIFWFAKFTPLFLIKYPIDRAIWFQGGTLKDYLLFRRSCSSYVSSHKYKDPDFPRCVLPETEHLRRARLLGHPTLRKPWSPKTATTPQRPSTSLASPHAPTAHDVVGALRGATHLTALRRMPTGMDRADLEAAGDGDGDAGA